MRLFAIVLVFSLSLCPIVLPQADEPDGRTMIGSVTKLPLPRYVSLRAPEINVRRGPGLDYRKDWVFRRAGLPVQVVEEYGDWRRITDKDQAGGWVYHAMITGRRTIVIVEDQVYLREEPTDTAAATAMAERGVIARLRACQPDWCRVEVEGYRGWVPKIAVWGVDADEVLED